MGIRSEVARLADLVAEIYSPASAWEQRLYEALRQIDDADDLGWWDVRYRHVYSQGASEQGSATSRPVQLFNAIFEFGAYNLYGRFDERGTAEQHAVLISQLEAEVGQRIPNSVPPTDW